jgi:hypothetical protein
MEKSELDLGVYTGFIFRWPSAFARNKRLGVGVLARSQRVTVERLSALMADDGKTGEIGREPPLGSAQTR